MTAPAGDFYTHLIEQKSVVELHLETGTKLIGVDDINAYTQLKYKKNPALVFSDGQENILILVKEQLMVRAEYQLFR